VKGRWEDEKRMGKDEKNMEGTVGEIYKVERRKKVA
jgi:hypothetical protein